MIQNQFIDLLEEFLRFGGMPEIVKTNDEEIKKQLLKEYVNTYINKDIRYFWKVESIGKYNDLLTLLASQIGGLLNYSEISNTLGLNRKTTFQMIELLTEFNLIHLLYPFYTNIRAQISKMKKVYFFDTGIRNQIIHNFNYLKTRGDAGALFENYIFNELKTNKDIHELFYFRTKNKTEIDFILRVEEKIILAEAKYQRFTHPHIPKAFHEWKSQDTVKALLIINLNLNYKQDKIIGTDFTNFLNIIGIDS